MDHTIYSKVLRTLMTIEGDHRKEFLAAFLGGILIDKIKAYSTLVRRKLGLPLLLDYFEGYGKMSWWWFNDELRERMLEAFVFAISNIYYRSKVIDLGKDGAKDRIIEALKYVKGRYPNDQNVQYILDVLENLKIEKKEYKLECKEDLRATFFVLTWNPKDVAKAFNKPFLSNPPRKDQFEIPDELINLSDSCKLRAKITAINLGFLEPETASEFFKPARFLIVVIPSKRKEEAITFMQNWYKSFDKVEVLGFITLDKNPVSFDREFIEKFEKVPVFVSHIARDILYNVGLIALEKI